MVSVVVTSFVKRVSAYPTAYDLVVHAEPTAATQVASKQSRVQARGVKPDCAVSALATQAKYVFKGDVSSILATVSFAHWVLFVVTVTACLVVHISLVHLPTFVSKASASQTAVEASTVHRATPVVMDTVSPISAMTATQSNYVSMGSAKPIRV